jgi:hypothetical protein
MRGRMSRGDPWRIGTYEQNGNKAWVPWVALEDTRGEMTKGLIVATMVDLVAHMMIPGVLMSMWSLLTMGVGWGGQQSQAARGTRPG